MPEKTTRFRIFRFREGDEAPHYQDFDIPTDDNTTVLVALQDIRRDHDPSLTLRHSCHHASCGTCGMRINGQDELACVVNVHELGTQVVTVEPLANAPVISDLVVDMEPFYQKYDRAGMAYVRPSEFLPHAAPPKGFERFERYENCIECGICVSACPITGSDESYLGPAALAAAWRVVQDPRGGDPVAALSWVDQESGCWRCHVAYECSEACPSEVDPAGAIMGLRKELTKQKIRRLFGLGR